MTRNWGGPFAIGLRVLSLGVLGLLVTAPGWAQLDPLVSSGHLIVRTTLDPSEVLVGQRSILRVDVLTKTWFPSAPSFPATIDVPKAAVVPPTSGQSISDRIDGETYSGVSRSYEVYPLGPGSIDVPAVTVRVITAVDGAQRSPEIALVSEALTVTAALPPGASDRGLVVATPRLEIEESWTPAPDDVRVGDGLVRTVVTAVEDSVGMILPALVFPAPDGVAVYRAAPSIEDTSDRGRRRGRRTDVVTYQLEEEGTFELPSIELEWWDLEAGRLRSETLPGVTLEVAPNPELAAEHLGGEELTEMESAPAPVERSWQWLRWPAWGALGLVLLGLLNRPFRHVLSAWKASESETREQRQAVHEVRRSARADDAEATYRALVRWLDLTAPDLRPPTLQRYAEVLGDPALALEVDRLLDARYGRGGSWTGGALLVAFDRSTGEHRGASRPPSPLPPLNPRREASPSGRPDLHGLLESSLRRDGPKGC